jgi:thymidylate kinase
MKVMVLEETKKVDYRKGKFVTFDGLPSSGRGTLSQALTAAVNRNSLSLGISVLETEKVGAHHTRSPLYRAVRKEYTDKIKRGKDASDALVDFSTDLGPDVSVYLRCSPENSYTRSLGERSYDQAVRFSEKLPVLKVYGAIYDKAFERISEKDSRSVLTVDADDDLRAVLPTLMSDLEGLVNSSGSFLGK